MKELIEKIMNRLQAIAVEEPLTDKGVKVGMIKVLPLKMAVDAIHEEAKAYNDGWIPVSSGKLPEEHTTVLVSFINGKVDILGFYNGLFHGFRTYGTDEVLAWKPKPLPPVYQPKGEV